MSIVELIFLIIFGFIIYKLLIEKRENFEADLDFTDDSYLDNLFDKMSKTEQNNKEPLSSGKYKRVDNEPNRYFTETQFNNNYRDTITAFNNIAPSQKQLFNKSDYPVKFTNPKVSEVKELVRGFITELNNNIKNNVSDTLDGNSGWDELMPEKNVKSGWAKQQEKLGLPVSIYNEPAKRAKVKLIKVDHLEKYSTDNQIRYVVYLILQKVNVSDQMIVRVSFVFDNMIDERKFFDTEEENKNNINVSIEEIFIVGFLTDDSFGAKSKYDDFYNFEGIENECMMDQKEIIKQLNDKYKQRQIESNGFSVDVSDPITGMTPKQINDLAIQRMTNKSLN